MNIDTITIRRLRDALIANGQLTVVPSGESGGAERARGRVKASLQRVAPFVETMYLMMIVDGYPDRAEKDVIRGALRMLTLGVLEDDELERILSNCEAQVREQGVEARLQAVGSRICADRMDRETAFSLAAAVALADGRLAGEESTLITSIAEWYGISTRRCAQILEQFEDNR